MGFAPTNTGLDNPKQQQQLFLFVLFRLRNIISTFADRESAATFEIAKGSLANRLGRAKRNQKRKMFR